MRILKTTMACLLAAALVGTDRANAAPAWNYKKNGADWGTTYTACTAAKHSPIDLKSGAPRVAAEKDNFQKHYQNLDNVAFVSDANKGLGYVKI